MAGQTKIAHTLNPDVIDGVEVEARRENRSRSNMIEVLLIEALQSRGVICGGQDASPGHPVAVAADPSESEGEAVGSEGNASRPTSPVGGELP